MTRACNIQLCEAGSPSAALSCGIGGEVVSSVVAVLRPIASGAFNATCDSTLTDWTSAASTAVASSGSSSSASCVGDVSSHVLSLCEGKEDCTVFAQDAAEAIGCTVPASALAVDVMVTCDNPSGIDPLSLLAVLFISFVGISLGTTITIDDFRTILRHKKQAFLVGVASQFGFMPLCAFALAHALGFESNVAIGVCLCGFAPGGSTSNLFTYWSKGNVALSIAMSAFSTVVSLFMIPLLFLIYVETTFARGNSLELPYANVIIVLVSIIIPVWLGMLIRQRGWQPNCGLGSCKQMAVHQWVEKIGSALGAIFLLAALVVGIRTNEDMLDPRDYWRSWVAGACFQPLGSLFGFGVATLAGMPRADVRAISLETGVQNSTLVIAIVALSFRGCERIQVLEFPLLCAFWYIIHSAWFTAALRYVHAAHDSVQNTPTTKIAESQDKDDTQL